MAVPRLCSSRRLLSAAVLMLPLLLFALIQRTPSSWGTPGAAVHSAISADDSLRSAMPPSLALTASSPSSEAEGDTVVSSRLQDIKEQGLYTGSWFQSDPECARYSTHLTRTGSMRDIRLVSYPRSGNTWTRYILEAATGIATCGGRAPQGVPDRIKPGAEDPPSVDELRRTLDEQRRTATSELVRMGFIGEDMVAGMGNCIAIKTSFLPPAWRRTALHPEGYVLPAILLVRDPFRSLISFRHFNAGSLSVLLNVSRAETKRFHGSDWSDFVVSGAENWQSLIESWATSPKDTLLVAYEELRSHPEEQLKKMLKFLRVTPTEGRLRCVLRHLEGNFHNKEHPVVPDKTVFDEETRLVVWDIISSVDGMLRERGYDGLPLATYSFVGEFT